MQKITSLLLAMIFASLSMSAEAQIFKNLFNSGSVSDVLTSVTGGNEINEANLEGKWSYVKPAVALDGGSTLENVAGSVASSQLESKINEYFLKVGIKAGTFACDFAQDGKFVLTVGSRNLNGSYKTDAENKTITFSLNTLSGKSILPLTANATMLSGSLNLLFKADKLLAIISQLSSLSDNATLQLVNTIVEKYEGLKIGFEFKKE